MDIPNLPTDNLYKFLALSGLALFIFSLYFGTNNSIAITNDINKINLQIAVLSQDSNKYQNQILDLNEKRYILFDYIVEKNTRLKTSLKLEVNPDYLKAILNPSAKSDSISTLNGLYYLSLRFPELTPYYIEYKNLYDEYLITHIEYNKGMIEKIKQMEFLQRKNTLSLIFSSLFSVVGFIGFLISIYGFRNWYEKIQIYQDIALKKSINPPSKTI